MLRFMHYRLFLQKHGEFSLFSSILLNLRHLVVFIVVCFCYQDGRLAFLAPSSLLHSCSRLLFLKPDYSSMSVAEMEETRSILRRILYVTIFCFAIYGITSIGILVDKSRKKASVSLSTALILLAILLAFLVIFTIIICLWRRTNQNIKSRQRGKDEEELYTTSPGGHRYIMTDSELRAIARKEKYERRQKDRRRSIWDRIHHAGDRISGRQISYPWDAKDERGDSLIGPGPLDSHSARNDTFVPRQKPLFGHGNGNGIFGSRPTVGAGLNPNHSRSPPASPHSPSRVRRTDGKTTYPPKAYHRPVRIGLPRNIGIELTLIKAGSVYTEKEFEEWARTQQNPNPQNRSPRKEGRVLAFPHVHQEEGDVASDHGEGKRKGGVIEGQRQKETGAGCEVPEESMEVLNASPPHRHPNTSSSRHIIPRKEVGTPSRRDPGILGAKLHDAEAGALMRESGVIIGYGGERVMMGFGRLPSKLVGHGLMAMPSQAHLNTSKEKMVGQGHAGHETWRLASGFYANRTDGILSMVSEEKVEGSGDSDGSGKSWQDMTADEVQRERNNRKAVKQKERGKEKYKAYTKRRETSTPRPLVVRNRTPTPPPPIKKDSSKKSTMERKDPRMNVDDMKASLTGLGRSANGVHRKTQQEKDRLEDERWLQRASPFHSDDQRAQTQTREDRKRWNTAPHQHVSALPDGLRIPPKQPALKKRMLSKKELWISTPECEGRKKDVEVLRDVHTSNNSPQTPHPNTTYKPYTQAITTKGDVKAAKNQPSMTEEQREGETEWQCQKRVREWTERNEAEQAPQDLTAALQPIETRSSPTSSLSPHTQSRQLSKTPAPDSFADWERRYRSNARKRGVSGFTSASISPTVSAFTSYEEMEQERQGKAAEEERRKFSQFMAETGNLRSSEIERVADSTLPIDHDELAKIDRMVDEQLEHQERVTAVAFDAFERGQATTTKRTTALDSLPSQRNLAETRLAQENQEWARKNHEAAAKLEVRSLHSTERGTTFSSFQTAAKASGSTPQGKSGIPRLATGATTTMQGATTTPAGRVRHLPRQFGYDSGKKGTPTQSSDMRKRPAKAQGQGSASKKANTNANNENGGTRPGTSGSSPKKDWI